ncbi:MAG: hypothetical protein Q8J63_02680 [Candidatus Aquicultor sp.]|nr:hypothetical protein [Candidatus Aquicultor sp.]
MLSDYPSRSDMRVEQKRRSRKTWVLFAALLLAAVVLGSTYSYWAPAQNNLLRAIKVAAGLKGDLRGELAESYPGQNPPEDTQVVVDDRPPIMVKSGKFLARDLATGKHIVRISGTGYEPVERTVNITQGANRVAVGLCLSPGEATRRWMKTKQENLHGETYKFLCPEEQAKVSRAEYIEYKNAIQKQYALKIVSFKVMQVNLLKAWPHPDTGKTYRDVAMIRIDGVIELAGSGQEKKAWDVYAKKYDDRWLFFAAN